MKCQTEPKTNVICIVPARNESWVLRHFIECASLWADTIIVGDHDSSDDTAEIARQYSKVRLISLHHSGSDRGLRRKILLDEARTIPGRRLIFSIDADEMLSANWSEDPEWALMLNARPGTRFAFDWLEILPGLNDAALFQKVVAFVDDGTDYIGTGLRSIHEPPIPATKGELVHLNGIKLLHYILIDQERMFSKHRWVKCLESVEFGKRAWDMCVMYQDNQIKSYDAPLVPIRAEWLAGYRWLEEYRLEGLSGRSYWYDEEVLNYFDKFGVNRFRKLNIWHVDWNRVADQLGRVGKYGDPRSWVEVWVHRFIEKHRENLKMKPTLKWKVVYKCGDRGLRLLGW
jgi:glycosyltransferase involved in cell wall biosynthesis